MRAKPALPRLRHNIAALGIVQISNYILPLITLPYLTRVLGAETYGKVAFAQVVMTYFVLLVDYGFSWSATRKISIERADREALSRTFFTNWAAQWLLVGLAALLASTVVLVSDRLRPDASLYAAAFTVVIGSAIFPIWFFQGLERLQTVAAIRLLSQTVALLPIFILIKQPSDAALLLLIQGAAALLGGVFALYWIYSESLVISMRPNWTGVIGALREGALLFSSRVAISLYSTLIPLVLGWVAGPIALAHFNIADKLRSAVLSLLSPVSQALFPRMSYLASSDGHAAFVLIKRSALVVCILAGAASASLWLLADVLVIMIGGHEFYPAGDVLRWMSPLPLVIGLSNILGVQIMLPVGFNKVFNLILFLAAATSILIVGRLVNQSQAVGAAQTVLAAEVLVTISMTVFLWVKGYLNKQRWVQGISGG